jgi:mono/diheme cytochrome c family protein
MIGRLAMGLALLLTAGCAGQRATAPVEPLESIVPPVDGAEVYRRACASCHGPRGLGDGPVAGVLTRRPTDLTRLATKNGAGFPRTAFIAVLAGDRQVAAHGSREMPVWSLRFGDTGASAVAALYAQRRAEALADYVDSLGRAPVEAGPY